jgi:hypothetical protein
MSEEFKDLMTKLQTEGRIVTVPASMLSSGRWRHVEAANCKAPASG